MKAEKKVITWLLLLCTICCAGILYAIYNKVNAWIDIAKWAVIVAIGLIVAIVIIWILYNMNAKKANQIGSGLLAGIISGGITYFTKGKEIFEKIEGGTTKVFNYTLVALVIVIFILQMRKKTKA